MFYAHDSKTLVEVTVNSERIAVREHQRIVQELRWPSCYVTVRGFFRKTVTQPVIVEAFLPIER